jgi:hypothetical protein
MLVGFIAVDQHEQLGLPVAEIHMRKSRESDQAGSNRYAQGPGGEGGSVFRDFLAQPTHFTDALSPTVLLMISLLLSTLLVGLAATALAA